MANFFFILLFFSTIALIAGFIRPSIFKRITKTVLKRKTVSLICVGIMVLSGIGIGIFTPSSEKKTEVNSVSNNIEPQANQKSTDESTILNADQAETENKDSGPVVQPENPDQIKTTEVSNPEQSKPPVKVEQPLADLFAVTKVTDGDTIKVNINGIVDTIRLIGINTPETVDPRKPVECFGIEASNRAKELLTGKKVRLEADSTQGERDKYGRLLRYVWMEDGTFFNKKMISDGYASEYTYNVPYKYQDEFKKAESEAKLAKRGLWADDACIQSGSQTSPPASVPSGHTFYTSSYYSAKYYYCDTDDGWKSLSPGYLKSFSTEAELLSKYPNHILHEPCK